MNYTEHTETETSMLITSARVMQAMLLLVAFIGAGVGIAMIAG